MSDDSLFVSCTPGLEPALGEELEELGLSGELTQGGAEAIGDYQHVNLWSRVATRVLVRASTANSPAELGRVSLKRFVRPGAKLFVIAGGERAEEWKRALKLPEGTLEPGVELQLRAERRRCFLSLDTSGEALYQRGHRLEVGKAPLRETLAAGVLRLAGWTPAEPLWDIMCGSGTFLLEAAEWGLGLAPGRARKFAFEDFPSHDAKAFAALPRSLGRTAPPLFGSDLNAGALGVARRNLGRAGVLEAVKLERLDATKLAPRPGPGLVLANLPYGKRVGEKSELGALYRAVGASVKRACAGWRFAFLLEEGAESLGLTVEQRVPVSNGGLRCTLVVGRV